MEYDKILSYLFKNNIADSLRGMLEKTKELNSEEITEELNSVWNSYSNMLSYARRGLFDPQGEKMRLNIVDDLIALVHKMQQVNHVQANSNGFIDKARKQARNAEPLEALVTSLENRNAEINDVNETEALGEEEKDERLANLYKKKDAILSAMFSKVLVNVHWKNAEIDQANRLLFSDTITTNDKCAFIGAMLMSLMCAPDKAKLLMLLDCYLINDVVISQRALVSFIIAHNMFVSEYSHSKEIEDRLAVYKTDSDFVADLNMAMMQLQMTSLTEKANDMLHKSIMQSTLMQGMDKTNKRDIKMAEITDIVQNGENIEWLLEGDGDGAAKFNDTIIDMYAMIREGADINFSSFITYKREEFFMHIPHWFYMFSMDMLQYVGNCNIEKSKQKKTIQMLFAVDQFCDSDQYSICYMMEHLPMLASGLGKGFSKSLSDVFSNPAIDLDELQKRKTSKASVRRRYIHDLYRLFIIGPHDYEVENPFPQYKSTPLSPLSYDWTKNLFADHPQELKKYADFLKRYEFYKPALEIYEHLATNEEDSRLAGIWQKIGYCYESLEEREQALHAYAIANDLKPNSEWTLFHMADNEVELDRGEEAVKHYTMLLEISPDNTTYLAQMTEAFVNMFKYEEALPISYKLNYISEEPEALLGLAFLLIATGRTDEAMEKLKDFESDDPTEYDKMKLLEGASIITKGSFAEGYAIMEKHCTFDSIFYADMCFDMLEHNKYIDKFNRKLIDDALLLHVNTNLV